MPRAIRRIFTVVYGLGIVAALGFGASQALGQAVYDCRYQPPTWLGACVEPGWNVECTSRCITVSGDSEAVGTCDAWPGCCVCLLR